jgi:cephalosporin hydroxylase
LIDLLRPQTRNRPGVPELAGIVELSRRRSDISDHLVTLFSEGVGAQPRLIVELGVRGGVSTFVLERVARLSGGIPLVSVDIDDCPRHTTYSNWHFVKADDIEFARGFSRWCGERQFPSSVDMLFIDTSHVLEHTIQEIAHWFPLLSDRATVCFHDTNQQRFYFRRDGSLGIGWNNSRGVIAAVEQYLETRYDERADFVDLRKGWLIKHWASCNGFTSMKKIGGSRF